MSVISNRLQGDLLVRTDISPVHTLSVFTEGAVPEVDSRTCPIMAQGHSEWILQSASFFWIVTLMLSESQSKKTQTYYMEGTDCGDRKHLGAAVVYSQLVHSQDEYYSHDVECRITFKAEDDGWRLMLRITELEIPDRTVNGLCNDALYVYDDSTIYTRAMEEAGGTGGLCGNLLPPPLYSSGQFLTVVFKTDSDGPVGHGFKFLVVAYSEDFAKYGTCGSSFQCDNDKCIEESLTCDSVDNCGDYSDETADGRARCREECGFICKFLSLGVTASIVISVGSIVILISCIVALVCCCRRQLCKKRADTHPSSLTATSVVLTNGMPAGSSCHFQGSRAASSAFSNPGYTQQGYYPMQPVYPPTSHSSVYSYAPFAVYSSQPSQHRSYTPTSSKSGKSNRSNNSTSVTFSQGTEKVSLPVNL